MIDVVVDALSLKKGDSCFTVTNFADDLENQNVVRLNQSTVGATETVLLALDNLDKARDPDSSLLLVDCDAIYHCDVVAKFRELECRTDVRAAVLCFEEPSNERDSMVAKYSYVSVNCADSRVNAIAEKNRVGPYANTGAYWFASKSEFQELAKDIMSLDKFEMGEAYVSCVLKEYVARNKFVAALVINASEYSNLGTPEHLEAHLQKQDHAFLFDLDGTLVNTTAAYVKAWNELLAPNGAFVDDDFFHAHISGKSDKQVSTLFNLEISSSDKDALFLKYLDLVKEIPGAVEFVRSCQKRGLVCIVTNSNQTAAKALLTKFALDDLPLVSANDCIRGKPNAEPYLRGARKIGVSLSQSIVFEDSRVGLISGRAARSKYVVSVGNNLIGSDAHLLNYLAESPRDLLATLNSVAHLSEELSEKLGQRSIVYPVRASGGYISEILSATSGSRRIVVKLENSDHGVLNDVSEHLHLHSTECIFYEDFASTMPVRVPICYGILPNSRAIIMEDLRKFDRAPTFSLESGLKVIKTMATMHSHFRGTPLGRLNRPNSYMREHMEKHFNTFRDRWSSTLRAEVLALFDHAMSHLTQAEQQLHRAPQTLLHGDLKYPNLFWDNNVSGGEPILIDWQYARPGNGIEDIIFLLVESCEISELANLAPILINSYYEEIQKQDGMILPTNERTVQVSSALAGFPLFVAIWFGCIDASKLTEPNFPFLFILRLAKAFKLLYDPEWFKIRSIAV